MNNLRCVELSADWEDRYNAFVRGRPEAMMYYDLRYRNLLRALINCPDRYLMAVDSSENIRGVLPLVLKEGSLGAVINSLPYYGSNGGILAADDEAFDFLATTYNALIADSQNIAASTLITNPVAAVGNYEKVTHNIRDQRIGQFTEIGYGADHEQKLMESFHHKTRNMVRKAQKQGISIAVENSQIDFLYRTHRQNIEAINGIPKPERFFKLVLEHYRADIDYKIYVARLDGEPIAALLLFYYNQFVEYYTPVIVEKYRDKQPLSLLIFEAMKQASLEGYALWNWGGTWLTQDGLYMFKKRWGTKDINYYYYTQINNERIFESSKEELLREYPWFFVLPFQRLVTE